MEYRSLVSEGLLAIRCNRRGGGDLGLIVGRGEAWA